MLPASRMDVINLEQILVAKVKSKTQTKMQPKAPDPLTRDVDPHLFATHFVNYRSLWVPRSQRS